MEDLFSTVAIIIYAIIVSLIMSELSKRFGGRQRIVEIQRFVNETNKQYFQAGRAGDEKKLAELDEKMKEFPKLMAESFVLQIKNLLIILPIFFIAIWSVKELFPSFLIELPVQLPVPRFRENMLFEMKNTFGAYGWFIISLAVFGGLTQYMLSFIDKRAATAKQKTQKEQMQKEQQGERQDNNNNGPHNKKI